MRTAYFPGFNGLRFFAAILVVIGHVEVLKEQRGYPNAAANPAVDELGRTVALPVYTLYILFLPQLAESLYPPVPYAEPLWSRQ